VQDIAKNGCGKLFVSIEACPVEYDLTAIADRTLRLGERPQPSTLHAGDQADQASGAWLRQGIGAPQVQRRPLGLAIPGAGGCTAVPRGFFDRT